MRKYMWRYTLPQFDDMYTVNDEDEMTSYYKMYSCRIVVKM